MTTPPRSPMIDLANERAVRAYALDLPFDIFALSHRALLTGAPVQSVVAMPGAGPAASGVSKRPREAQAPLVDEAPDAKKSCIVRSSTASLGAAMSAAACGEGPAGEIALAFVAGVRACGGTARALALDRPRAIGNVDAVIGSIGSAAEDGSDVTFPAGVHVLERQGVLREGQDRQDTYFWVPIADMGPRSKAWAIDPAIELVALQQPSGFAVLGCRALAALAEARSGWSDGTGIILERPAGNPYELVRPKGKSGVKVLFPAADVDLPTEELPGSLEGFVPSAFCA
jgi:hypothetical protein